MIKNVFELKTKKGGRLYVEHNKDGQVYSNCYQDGCYIINQPEGLELINKIENAVFEEDAVKLIETLNGLPLDKVGMKYSVSNDNKSKSKTKKLEDLIDSTSEPVAEVGVRNYMAELMRYNKPHEVVDNYVKMTENELSVATDIVERLRKFFSEFNFNPAARFINTLNNKLSLDSDGTIKGKNRALDYVKRYFELQGHPDAENIALKIKEPEFDCILDSLALLNKHDKKINSRIMIYYGEAGAGKTTEATKKNKDADVIIMNSLMNEQDLLEVPVFNKDGILTFRPSPVLEAIVLGGTVILDEINLANMQVLRFLQGLTDAKEYFTYMSKSCETVKVYIHPNFKIVGTMNLYIEGQIYNLPEPLVDRCEDIIELDMSADKMAKISF